MRKRSVSDNVLTVRQRQAPSRNGNQPHVLPMRDSFIISFSFKQQ
ncbi:hypothetical protein [Lysinibacillus xylanilyticus]